MENNSISIKKTMLICLTIAVVVTFFGVAVKALSPVFAKNESVIPSSSLPGEELPAEVLLDPNLSDEARLTDGSAVYAADCGDGFAVAYNQGETGYIAAFDRNASPINSVCPGGKISKACSYGDNLFAAVVDENGFVKIAYVNVKTGDDYLSRSYGNQTVLFAVAYEDGAAFVFKSEGQSGKRVVLRFYNFYGETVERYAVCEYDVSATDLYRIGDRFTLFFSYSSDFSAGGGYANFSLSSISAKITLIERNHPYTLFSAVPRQEGFALLCLSEQGCFIMQTDENLARKIKIDLTEQKFDGGRLCFDGKTYYALLFSEEGGCCFALADQTVASSLSTYESATGLFGEINTGARLVHLLSCEGGFFLSSTEGLFTKKVGAACAVPVGLVKTERSRAAVCNVTDETGNVAVYAYAFN